MTLNGLPPQATEIINAIRQGSKHDCIMRGKGSKIPRGATIDGIEVVWAQHGIISGPNGQQLGSYDRMEEFSGENKDRHALLVTTLTPVEVIAPDGTVCQEKS